MAQLAESWVTGEVRHWWAMFKIAPPPLKLLVVAAALKVALIPLG